MQKKLAATIDAEVYTGLSVFGEGASNKVTDMKINGFYQTAGGLK